MDDVACPEASRCGLVSIGSRKLLCLDWRQRSTCVNTRRRGGAPLDARRPRCSLAGQVWVRCCAHIRDIAGASVSGAVHGPGDTQRWVLSTFRTSSRREQEFDVECMHGYTKDGGGCEMDAASHGLARGGGRPLASMWAARRAEAEGPGRRRGVKRFGMAAGRS